MFRLLENGNRDRGHGLVRRGAARWSISTFLYCRLFGDPSLCVYMFVRRQAGS